MGNFFGSIWNGIKVGATWVWHVIGGAVTGVIVPTVTNSLIAGQLTKASLVSTVVGGVVGAVIGYAQHSNNQTVASVAGQVTPDMQKQIDDKVTAAILAAKNPPATCPTCNQPVPPVTK